MIRDLETNRVVFNSTAPAHRCGRSGLRATKPLVAGGTTTGLLSLPPLPTRDYTVRAAACVWGTDIFMLRIRK